MFRTLLCVVATITTYGAGTASAATFNFETNVPFGGNALSYTEGGVSLSVTANGDRVVNTRLGLGVNDVNNANDTGRITVGESIIFTVGPRPIRSLISVMLEGGPEEERFDFVVGQTRYRFELPAEGGRSRVSFDLSDRLPPGTTQFSFEGVEEENSDPQSIRRGVLISSLEIAAVPVPAAILSLGTGLALFGALGGLRRASSRNRLLGKAVA